MYFYSFPGLDIMKLIKLNIENNETHGIHVKGLSIYFILPSEIKNRE